MGKNDVKNQSSLTPLIMLGGGKFANGAMTGAFGHLFNCGFHECLEQGAFGALKAGGGALAVAGGAAICPTTGLGCAIGVPMMAIGVSDAVQGGDMVYDAIQGITSEGFNPIKSKLQAWSPSIGGALYDGASLVTNVASLGAKVPAVIGATDGIQRVKSMFGVTVRNWNNAKFVGVANIGVTLSQSANRAMASASALWKTYVLRQDVK